MSAKRADEQEVARLRAEGKTVKEIAACLGVAQRSVYKALARAAKGGVVVSRSEGASETPPGLVLMQEEFRELVGADRSRELRSVSSKIKTVEQALEKAGLAARVASGELRVTKSECTSWEMGYKDDEGKARTKPLWRVFARVEPLGDGEVQWEKWHQRTLQQMDKHVPVYDVVRYVQPSASAKGKMLEVDILDVHLGMYSWGMETGKSYDSEIAATDYMRVLEKLLQSSSRWPCERVVLPVGNDFLHCDTELRQTTSESHAVDVDTRASRVFENGKLLLVQAVDTLLAHGVSVHVPVVPGNHDRQAMIHMGHVLSAWYKGAGGRVSVDFSPPPRKYLRWGRCLLGWAHGDKVKLQKYPMLMAHERKRDWAETSFRRWRIGHEHRAQGMSFLDEQEGVELWRSRALAPADAWHVGMGFVGTPRGGSATVWDVEEGPMVMLEARV